MNQRSWIDRGGCRLAWTACVTNLGLVAVLAAVTWGADEPRLPIGKCVTPLGSLLQRQPSAKTWQALKPQESVHSGDLLVALPGAALDSKNGSVRLALLADLAQVSPYPVLESAVVVHDNPRVDLDFTLDRGRVDVTNRKTTGSVQVRVRFHNEAWELNLAEPGTRVGLELYGRWPRGVPFTKTPKPEDVPTADLLLVMLKGQADLKAGGSQFALQAPPGPASFHWDSIGGADRAPKRLEKLPDWAEAKAATTDRAKELQAAVERLRQRSADKPIASALTDALSSTNNMDRELAVAALGALDDLPRLVDALADAKHPEMRGSAILALRHWIGRGPGQDQRLDRLLVEDKKYSPSQAEILLSLLHSFSDVQRQQRETYEALIAYLQHDKLAIRELARWHLARLASAGKDITYDAAAPATERERAVKKWQALLQEGKLPSK
jgi:hypothetical protein